MDKKLIRLEIFVCKRVRRIERMLETINERAIEKIDKKGSRDRANMFIFEIKDILNKLERYLQMELNR